MGAIFQKGETTMKSKYDESEVIEIGIAQDLILGGKDNTGSDDFGTKQPLGADDFDE